MHNPFDELTKSLVEDAIPRRESLRRFGAALIGGVLAPLGWAATTEGATRRKAATRRKGSGGGATDACISFCRRCKSKSNPNNCIDTCRACGNDPANIQGACGAYVCCGPGQTFCNGRCVNTSTDNNNCGGCGIACSPGSTCVSGACTCTTGFTNCNGTCVNTSNDNLHCGACGNVCPASAPTCEQGVCTDSAPCQVTQTRCDGVCYDLNNDPNNCGATCDTRVVCGQFETCTAGVCVPVDAP